MLHEPGQTDIEDLSGNGKGVAINIEERGLLYEYHNETIADEIIDRARLVYNLDNSTVLYGDGLTAGGIPLMRGYTGSSVVFTANTIAQVKATQLAVGKLQLLDALRGGIFYWIPGDFVAAIATDPNNGVYIPSNVDLIPGTTGAWVRIDQVLRPYHFGAIGDGVTDDTAAFQAFNDWYFLAVRSQIADFTGNYAISSKVSIGPTAIPAIPGALKLRGNLRLVPLNGMFEVCRLRNLNEVHWHGSFFSQSIGGSAGASFAARLNAVGFALENCGNMKVTGGFLVDDFWYCGVVAAVVNNDGAELGRITARRCGSGSGDARYTLAANWSGAVNGGVTNSAVQFTTLSVDAFPNAAIETYQPLANQNVYVYFPASGTFHRVTAWDRTAGTITIYPWIDNTIGTSGSLNWCFGGGFVPQTSDGNCIVVDKLKSQGCGIGLNVESLYGPRVNQANISNCGIGIKIGMNLACVGTSVDGFYPEGNLLDIGFDQLANQQSYYNYINSGYELDLAKIKNLKAARQTDNSFGAFQSTLSSGEYPALTLAYRGRILTGQKRNLSELFAVNYTFQQQTKPPSIFTQNLNSQTITLSVQAQDFNRLFGYSGGVLRYIGTGTNGAPTGTFTFVPPAGGTINGGAVDASVTFTGFDGPVDFQIEHTDKAQLTWRVYPVAGWSVPVAVESSNSTAYTLVLLDRGKHKRFTSATAKTVTVPPNSAVAFQIGDFVDLEQSGSGLLTIAAGAGVTIRSRGGLLNANGQYSFLKLRKVGTDEWLLTGDRA